MGVFFDSWTFAVFALVVFPLYYVLPLRPQNLMLLAASYVFYGAWDPRFLLLIVLSTIVDFFVGKALGKAQGGRARRGLLALSVAVNLGILGVFNYFNFFAASAASALGALGYEASFVDLSIVLPVGISFYTFQTMSYTIDIYRGSLKPTRNFFDFALFVAYFPQLVAGPIERASRLLPQIAKERRPSSGQMREGAWLVLLGLFKKVVLADNLGILVDAAFGGGQASGFSCLLAVYAFAYQIYCDFSGYSDIARGLAKLMGIELMKNFDRPYVARSPREFWQRWHISLSTWLRDYLYIPLGGNRGSEFATGRNLMITMLLGGLWHGAAWTFVLWGLYQGVILIGHRVLSRWWTPGESTASVFVQRVVMFHFICFGWLIFRATSMEQIGMFLSSIVTDFTLDTLSSQLAFHLFALAGLLWFIETLSKNEDDPSTFPGWSGLVGPTLVSLLLLAIVVLAAPGGRAFIYFQF